MDTGRLGNVRSMNPTPSTSDVRDRVFTRRNYMVYRAVMGGEHTLDAMQRVDAAAEEAPDVDMDETMTWAEWEAYERGQSK